MGLNDEYSHIRTHILSLRELPNLDVVYDIILNDESQQKVTKNPHIEASALYSNQQDNAKGQMRMSQGKFKGRMFCTHCQVHGHTKEFCYKLNGYPLGHKLYKGNAKNGNSARTNGNNRAAENFVSLDNSGEKETGESSKGNNLIRCLS
ncbi:hypothetical protein QQ045_018459 [Rhodiola kirilowii]